MAEVRNHFCSELDHTNLGVTSSIAAFETLLKQKDPTLAETLEQLQVAPTLYVFRWLTLLMTQEFELPDVLRLWDSLLADPQRFEFLPYFCVAMVLSIRDELLSANDFAHCVNALHHFEGRVQMDELLCLALRLYAADMRTPTPL